MPFPFRLFQELFEVLQVVAGNEDRLALLCSEGYLSGNGMAVGPRIPRVEQLHGPDVRFTCLHGEPHPVA